MIGQEEILFLFSEFGEIEEFKEDARGSNWPSRSVVLQCRRRAVDRATFSASPAEEVAALFFEFSHSDQLGYAGIGFPYWITIHQMAANGLHLRTEEDYRALRDLQDEIAEGDREWDSVMAWFEEMLVPV
ncbi:MAG: hypothetical protein IT372_36785 [Polyangiaceae bacterium]|nr:hypothetical protein [Polyangiaceae bacterium]